MTEFEERMLEEMSALNQNLEEISATLQYMAEISIDEYGNMRIGRRL